jgi:hypothetical protein
VKGLTSNISPKTSRRWSPSANLLGWTVTCALAATLVPSTGCKEEEIETAGDLGDPCTPGDEEPCVSGLVCEARADGGENICAGPVEIRGMVIDGLDESPIEGARVLALDDTGAPVSDVAISDADGMYALPIAIPRDSDGNPATALTLTLQSSARDYKNYPSGLQPAFPVSTAEIMEVEDDPDDDTDDHLSYIENASTTIGMLPLDEADKGGFTISGRVEGEEGEGAGTLVVAEGPGGSHTVADQSGAFTIFNVQDGGYSVRGYLGGLQLTPADVTVEGADVEDVLLSLSEDGTATVSGTVNIVNAPGGALTSVVLIPSGLFNEVFEFGPVPFGLRAPEPGVAPDVSSAWTIEGVPVGTYKVIASLENDDLVRDPDTSIAGTEIVEITVGAGETIDVPDSFKVTEALAV